MKRRTGFGVADCVVAVAMAAAALVPLLELARSDTASIRVHEREQWIGNLAWDLLERIAARPRWPDPLRRKLEEGGEFPPAAVARLAGAIAGTIPPDLATAIERTGLSLEVRRQERQVGPRGLEGMASVGLEIWTVTARWQDGKSGRARFFFRVSAQG